jgi:two-component system LytT family response regulator
MRIKSIVIEDEPLALKKLVSFIDKIEYLEIAKTFDNAIEAISYLKSNDIDLIFLDIQMEEFSGIQFLETLNQRPKVIITTAYDKYALKGYELDVFDYLLKPFTFERFIKAVDKVFKSKLEKPASVSNDSIFVKTEYKLVQIKISEILYIEGMSEYLRLVTSNKKIMTKQNFKNIEAILPKINFVRVHKSYMIAIDKIENIERNRIKINDMFIPISDSYKDIFYDKIGISKQK